MRPARVAELIADALRAEILDRTITDELPKEDELRERFGVGKTSMREALLIFESEGLISVRRGKVGGSTVHLPTSASAAYTLGLVLTADRVTIGELGDAIAVLEPHCALLCSQRTDRVTTVVPQLTALNDEMAANLDDVFAAVSVSRLFHEAIVDNCGNGAIGLLTGSLERVWSAHERQWAAEVTGDDNIVPMANRHRALDFHVEITGLIKRGDESVAAVLGEHLAEAQGQSSSDRRSRRIDITSMRAALQSKASTPGTSAL